MELPSIKDKQAGKNAAWNLCKNHLQKAHSRQKMNEENSSEILLLETEE